MPDWAQELLERERVLTEILNLAERLGVSFAFPTQTLELDRWPATGEPSLSTMPPQEDLASPAS